MTANESVNAVAARIEADAWKQVSDALDHYRGAIRVMADGKPLAAKDSAKLPETMRQLGFTTEHLRADVAALQEFDRLKAAVVDSASRSKDLEAEVNRAGAASEEHRRMMAVENGNAVMARQRLMSLVHTGVALDRQQWENPRLFAPPAIALRPSSSANA